MCVVDILGGCGLASRLEALGIRPGTNIIKRSEMFMKGDLTVESHGTPAALGYVIGSKILVRPVGKKPNKPSGKNGDKRQDITA